MGVATLEAESEVMEFPTVEENRPAYKAPSSQYFKTKEELAEAVGLDFIKHANECTRTGEVFLVGLSHGVSPSKTYQYILDHFSKLRFPEHIRYTFVNSKLKRQRGLTNVLDAIGLLKALLNRGLITKDQILGRSLDRDNIDAYSDGLNKKLTTYLKKHKKVGLDYIFLATDPSGRVAGITTASEAFGSTDLGMVVMADGEKELTLTPHFLLKASRIAFLATKQDKRRSLAMLFYQHGRPNRSPSFLRYMPDVEKRITVFVDDKALTWPQIEVERETPYGISTIRVDTALPYTEYSSKKKLPVVLLVHGFLGLNSFDGLLTAIPSKKYIAAAMHYGSIPNELPPERYSKFVVNNVDAVIAHFGKMGHPVYLFDHSMGNIYFMMMDKMLDQLDGVKKHLKGRIGANPFFGEESKHALLGFFDNVILLSDQGPVEKAFFLAARGIIPWDTKSGVRTRGIALSEWLIKKDSSVRERVWKSVKDRILYLMSNLGSLPHLNRIPIEKALSRLPAKLFAIQTHSALQESKQFDKQRGLENIRKHGIPILILKSQRDGVAKYVHRMYQDEGVEVMDITDFDEKDLFREHLFHMVQPKRTIEIIDDFIKKAEKSRKPKKKKKISAG